MKENKRGYILYHNFQIVDIVGTNNVWEGIELNDIHLERILTALYYSQKDYTVLISESQNDELEGELITFEMSEDIDYDEVIDFIERQLPEIMELRENDENEKTD